MGFTSPDFNLAAEVAISLSPDQGDIDLKEGDIVTSRRPVGGVGTKEVNISFNITFSLLNCNCT